MVEIRKGLAAVERQCEWARTAAKTSSSSTVRDAEGKSRLRCHSMRDERGIAGNLWDRKDVIYGERGG
jgi:hypothetical protein